MTAGNPISRVCDLLDKWSFEVDEAHAEPGSISAMRDLANEARAEYARIRREPGASLEALIKTWAARELDHLPRGPARDWVTSGNIPRALQALLAGLPEPVAALIGAHVADDLGECECCRRRAPLRLQSDRSESGESDWRCAWGCPSLPGEAEPLLEWARSVGL